MEPKPPRGADLPIWIGGHSEAAFRRAGRFADGWMGVASEELFENGHQAIASVRGYADRAGRDPEALEFQAQVSPPPRPGNESDRTFYTEPDRVAAAAAKLGDLGFDGVALNLTGLFLAGARSVDSMIDGAAALHQRLRAELG
jgi:alkanesulfonate monooxygenase SsuD/methylene tetrahydromethanopterin reductase-like flavin-dependent oxidoreductase (luciferase family)